MATINGRAPVATTIGLAVLLTASILRGQEPADASPSATIPDVSKRLIEQPVEAVLAGEPVSPVLSFPEGERQGIGPADMAKMIIEQPIERLLASQPDDGTTGSGNAVETDGESQWVTRDENPAVPPGLVHWHSRLETACRASEQSGKPVLLFQLMGQLDREFT